MHDTSLSTGTTEKNHAYQYRLPHLQRQLIIHGTIWKQFFYSLFPLSRPFFHTLVSLTGKQLEIRAPNNYPVCVCVYFILDWKWLQHRRDLILTSGVVLPPLRRPIIEDLTPVTPSSCGIYPGTLPRHFPGISRENTHWKTRLRGQR